MKKKLCGVALLLAVLLGSLTLAGCPRTAQLEITPAAIVFSEGQTERRLTLSNMGSRPVDWTLDTVVRESEESAWAAGDIEWLAISSTEGVLAPGVEHITLSAERTGQEPGTYGNAAVRIQARNFERIVPVSLVVSSLLVATPEIVTLRAGALNAQFRLENRGDTPIRWAARFFDGNDATVDTTELPPDMTLTPDGGVLARQSSVSVLVEWREPREDFGLRISIVDAGGHDAVVRFRFGVPLTDLVVEPETLRLFYSPPLPGDDGGALTQPASTLTLRNAGRSALQWRLAVRSFGQAMDQATAPIVAEPVSDTLAPGDSVPVRVRVSDPAEALSGAGNYEIAIEVTGQDGVVIVPLVLDAVSLPVVIASDPPDPNALAYTRKRVLDFGRTTSQKEFWVLNIGPFDSRLYFRVRHEDDDPDIEDPLIINVNPVSGDTTGPEGVFPVRERLVNAQRVVVTIDRSAMREDLETRDIYIEAWDEDGENRLDAVEPWHIRLRAERAPMRIEGATNRSRPPFLMRFVFSLRDRVGQIIPTRTPSDLERIRFDITEDGVLLDLDETVYYVEGPEQLKVNMVVMLDYTGSMYYAGVDERGMRAPGEVLDEVREAVAMFLDDLPPSYRVALMYHNDRQPLNRLIHPFSTDRESLKSALRNFEVPPAMHGTSDIWDAVTDAVERIVAEDAPDTLPFDDADLRAVLFITDGNDNSSVEAAGSAASTAFDNRVRLYPLAYSSDVPINYVDLMPMAEDTGGRLYVADEPERLVRLLGHRRSLVLQPVTFDPAQGVAEFRIKNAGRSPMTWSVIEEDTYNWISDISPTSGSTAPNGETLVSITVDPDAVTGLLEKARGTLTIDSNDGQGEVQISLALEPGTTDIQQLALSLRDEPGLVWEEMQNQIVLSYVTPSQTGGQYSIRATYTMPDDREISAFFEETGVFYPGDVRAGQISMHTTGIAFDENAETWEDVARAEVYVRADYVPRNVNSFRVRFIPMLEEDMPLDVQNAFLDLNMKVELAPDGLLVFDSGDPTPNWRLVPENDGIYRMLTPREFVLPYAATGNLLRITFTNLWPLVDAADAAGIEPAFLVDMRVDNDAYFEPATSTGPSQTVYFLYPSGPTNPDRPLRVGEAADLAAPAANVGVLVAPDIDPEEPGVWDRDGDGLPDFMDPYPDDDSRPGRLTRPGTIRFVPGTTTVPVTIVNNRWDRFRWTAGINTPTGSRLRPEQFTWSVFDDTGTEVVLAPGEMPDGMLRPGETEDLLLHFDPMDLESGLFPAQLTLDTDVFGLEITAIEAQP